MTQPNWPLAALALALFIAGSIVGDALRTAASAPQAASTSLTLAATAQP